MTGSPIVSVNFAWLFLIDIWVRLAGIFFDLKKKTQAILKCFTDLKPSVWFALGQKTKPCFVTLRNFFRSTVGHGFQNTKLTGSPIFSVNFTNVLNCLFLLGVQNEIQLLSRLFCNSWLVFLLRFLLTNAPLVKVIENPISDGIVFKNELTHLPLLEA